MDLALHVDGSRREDKSGVDDEKNQNGRSYQFRQYLFIYFFHSRSTARRRFSEWAWILTYDKARDNGESRLSNALREQVYDLSAKRSQIDLCLETVEKGKNKAFSVFQTGKSWDRY